MKRYSLVALLCSLICLPAKQPNILMILADDMGYGDLGCTGSTSIKTPHIDKLAQRGVLCTQFYVPSSVCSPSRAGILTGRDPRRFGYEGNLNKRGDAYPTRHDLLGLPTSEHTLADHLKSAGYATALIGKWHQGLSAPFHPNVRGFDHFWGMLGGGHDYFPTLDNNRLQENGEPITELSSPYITDLFTDQAIAWIKQQSAENPWFLFASYNAPHTPMQATKEDLALYSHLKNEKRRTYAAMMHALDRGVGRLTNHLEEAGNLENTLIIFFSDNGGATNNGSWNGKLAGHKGSMREGGIRVPFILSWPSMLASRKNYTDPISALDLLPTFMAAANAKPLPLRKAPSYEDTRNRHQANQRYGAYEGQNLLPKLLSADGDVEERLLFWRLQGQSAVLSGKRKLIKLSHRPAQLFSPATDPSERQDLAGEETAKLAELFQLLGDWESSLATAPLWDSSPRWNADTSKIYDTPPIKEPK